MSITSRMTTWIWCGAVCAAPAAAQETPLLPEELILMLQGGGYVVYIVHSDVDAEIAISADTRPEMQCPGGGALSALGHAKARAIGGGFDRLDIPVAEVIAGECCAAWNMASVAFAEVPIRVRAEDVTLTSWQQPSRPNPDMQGPMPAGRSDNVVLIGHVEALRAILDDAIDEPGIAHVLSLEQGGFALQGTIPAEAWFGF